VVLACNATEALVALGHWDQAEQVSSEALEVASSDAILALSLLLRAALELGRGDLDAAEARLRTVRRLLPAPIPEAQKAGPLFAGLAELARWRGDLDQAKQLVAEALPLVAANPRYAAPIYALGLRVEADHAELARHRHPGQPPPDDGTATTLLKRLDQAAADKAAAGIPELAAWHTLGLAPSGPGKPANRTRRPGRPQPPNGSGWASPTESPTPASARPRRCWPPATATPPRWCWAAPPSSPAASAPAISTPRSRPWRGAPAWTWPRTPAPWPRHSNRQIAHRLGLD
jgi:hypothetical protein